MERYHRPGRPFFWALLNLEDMNRTLAVPEGSLAEIPDVQLAQLAFQESSPAAQRLAQVIAADPKARAVGSATRPE